MSTSSNRRFIAGAVCPRCAQMDKIVVDLETDVVGLDLDRVEPGHYRSLDLTAVVEDI